MRIGMVCYASLGGSGVVATELARALAARGHDVHLISSDPPFRWQDGLPRLTFHKVTTPSYPLFREPQVSRPIPADPVQPGPADSASQAENASSMLVTRSEPSF